MKNIFCLFTILSLFFIQDSKAEISADFKGAFIQGGLIIGKTSPNARIYNQEQKIPNSRKGYFLIGLGRNAPSNVTIRIDQPGEKSKKYDFKIKQRKYKISKITGLPERKVTPKKQDSRQINSDYNEIREVRKLYSELDEFPSNFVWPVKGRISDVFGSTRILNDKPRNPHNGVDIAAPLGTEAVATADGIIRLVNENMFFTGKTIMIDHGYGLSSIYVHLSKITVKLNQVIKQGQEIGLVGMTGRATGPHLHWGVSLFEKHIDPELLINMNKY